jgi:transposase
MTTVCASRMPAKGVRETRMFRWLAGGQAPDFRTLNDFRGNLLTAVLEAICVTAVKLLKATGYINGETYGVDGTKIESTSGRYLFVWSRA